MAQSQQAHSQMVLYFGWYKEVSGHCNKDRQTIKISTEKMKDSLPFAKLKEVLCQHPSRHKSTTFNFARPHNDLFTIKTLTLPLHRQF